MKLNNNFHFHFHFLVYASNQSIISSYGATQNISTVDISSSNSTLSSYLPKGGLHLLNNIPSIHIHQIYELSDCKKLCDVF